MKGPTTDMGSTPPRYYRLRAPHRYSDRTTAVTVREGGAAEIYLSVGAGNARMGITREDAWALWQCLGAALHGSPADNRPPDWLTAPVADTPTAPPKAEPTSMGTGRLTDDRGQVTELQMPDSAWATPRPGVRQVWGWIVGDAPCPVGHHDRLRLELPDGTILLGPGRVEVARRDGRRRAKVYILSP